MDRMLTWVRSIRVVAAANPRTRNITDNVFGSFGLKALALLISLIQVPMLLNFLTPEKYGVWLTVYSIAMWLSYFDLGLGSGLRNNLIKAWATGDLHLAKRLTSTAYIALTTIMALIIAVVLPFSRSLIDWNKLLNFSSGGDNETQVTMLLLFLLLSCSFVLKLINDILKADQRSALAEVYLPVSGAVSVGLLFFIQPFSSNSLVVACLVVVVPQLLLLLISNIYYFSFKYRAICPSYRFFDRGVLKNIFSLGAKFFVFQLVGFLLFSSQNFLIAHLLNPEKVSSYHIARQYFSIPLTFAMIVFAPYWSAVAEASQNGDGSWIRNSMRKLNYISVGFSFIVIVMLLLSNWVYGVWIHDRISVPIEMSVGFAVLNILMVIESPYGMFLNGFGKLSLRVYLAVFKLVCFLPVAIYLIGEYGSIGLVIALIVINAVPNVVARLQYRKLINGTAKGLWGD